MGRPRANDYDGKRRAILDRSATLFAEHGFANTTVSMIATSCGASKGRLYHYYDSKEAVLFDLLDHHLRGLVAAVRDADDPSAAPRERLRRLVVALLGAYEHADDTHRVQLGDLGRLPVSQRQHLKRLQRQIVDVFAAALLAAAPGLERRPEQVTPATMSLLGMLNWQHTWFRADGRMDLEAYAGLVVDLVLGGLPALTPEDPL